MKTDKIQFSKTKIWLVFVVLFICGSMVGIGIANWGHAIKNKQVEPVVEQKAEADAVQGESGVAAAMRAFIEREKAKSDENTERDDVLTQCQAVEKVLLDRIYDDDSDCYNVRKNLELYRKLATYGCEENVEKYRHEIDNKTAVFEVACNSLDIDSELVDTNTKTCEKIERNLTDRLPGDGVGQSASGRIDRAKIYAIMAEKGCPEHSAKYVDLAKQELEIARAIQDDNFNEDDTIEIVETYKRIKMQQDAEEIFDKVKKMTNPAIDFIMQVEKIINE